jgi:hypothetical protein
MTMLHFDYSQASLLEMVITRLACRSEERCLALL